MPAIDYHIHVYIQLFNPDSLSTTFGQLSVKKLPVMLILDDHE